MYPVLHSSSQFNRPYTESPASTNPFSATVWPSSSSVPQIVKTTLARFFALSDANTADANRRLGEDVFASDGQIIVNKKSCSGAKEISASNQATMAGMRSRRHNIERVYARSTTADDLILIGSVKWVLKDGRELDGRFATRACVDSAGKIKLLQIWADLLEFEIALAEQVTDDVSGPA